MLSPSMVCRLPIRRLIGLLVAGLAIIVLIEMIVVIIFMVTRMKLIVVMYGVIVR